jgi:hypothetical protein
MICQTLIDNCDSAPCQNGGICTNMVNNYTCNCSGLFYEGVNCENSVHLLFIKIFQIDKIIK